MAPESSHPRGQPRELENLGQSGARLILEVVGSTRVLQNDEAPEKESDCQQYRSVLVHAVAGQNFEV